MTISVVQSTTVPGAFSGNFSSNITAGNTIFIVLISFSTSNVTISSSSPTFNGSSVSGSAEILTGSGVQSAFASSQTVYLANWMLPNVSGGATSVAVTVTNGSVNAGVGLLIYEVAGLGTSPTVDKKNSGSGSSASITSGASGNTTQNAEFVLGSAANWNGMASPGAPWTSLAVGGSPSSAVSGYQIQSSSGNTYTWSGTQASGAWAAGVVTVYAPSVAVSGTVQPLATFRPLRSKLSRGITGFVPVVTINTGHGPAGTVQPLAVPAAAPRRKPARTVTQFTPVATTNNTHPVIPVLPQPTGGGKSMLSRYMRWADL